MTFIDTWSGDQGAVIQEPQSKRKPDDYRNVRLSADLIERGAPVANPPKPIEAHWVIGFDMETRPYAALHCTCRAVTHFDLGGTGVAPVARCCKNAPAYPQDRQHTAHLLALRVEPNAGRDGGVVAQPGLPPEPGTVIAARDPSPNTEQTAGQNAEFIERLVQQDMAGARKTGEFIYAALKTYKQK
jgi:hypothetical protein